jgi:hypothetical protein
MMSIVTTSPITFNLNQKIVEKNPERKEINKIIPKASSLMLGN